MKNISSAYAKAFASISSATKDADNPHYRSKYADLASVVAAIKPALVSNDLFFTQITHANPEGIEIETILGHASGETMPLGSIFIPVNRKDAQAFGSAITYARRYALQTAFGVPAEDDDGNAATKAAPEPIAALIDDAQWAEITSLLQATKSNVDAFCKAYAIKNVKELPAGKFDHAKRALNRKLSNMVEEEKAND